MTFNKRVTATNLRYAVPTTRRNGKPAAGSRNADTRQKIIDAARSVFASRGYIGTTVEDIIEACEVSRGTFYYYFKNKEAAFEQLVDTAVGEMERLTVQRTPLTDPYLKIESANRGYLDSWLKNRDIHRNLYQVSTFDEHFAQVGYGMKLRFINRIQRSLERQSDETLRTQLDPQVVACALGGMLDSFAYSWLGTGAWNIPFSDMERVVTQVSEVWYHALYGGRPHLGGLDGEPCEPALRD
jgi:AcrR family transcriptional regulator